jgi:hypothetical protein
MPLWARLIIRGSAYGSAHLATQASILVEGVRTLSEGGGPQPLAPQAETRAASGWTNQAKSDPSNLTAEQREKQSFVA